NFGLEKHPAWSSNLIANPHAEIHYRRQLVPVRATLLPPPPAGAWRARAPTAGGAVARAGGAVAALP
ncbi:MAG TPA: nitroreductase/quinone reductase family protein, partial [Rhodoglobus sp.]|nr:nitroreductase/quinone reductase family protein [Rhodoglobus sp.]